jgi:hypothetical protein
MLTQQIQFAAHSPVEEKGGPFRGEALEGRGPWREGRSAGIILEGGGPKYMGQDGEMELRTIAPAGEVCACVCEHFVEEGGACLT